MLTQKLAVLSLGLGSLTAAACAHQAARSDKPPAEIRRVVTEPVHLAVIAAVVAPEKAPIPPAPVQGSSAASLALTAGKLLRLGNPVTLGLVALGFLFDTKADDSTPSPRIEVNFNAEEDTWLKTGIVHANYEPTWQRAESEHPRAFTSNSNLMIGAWDGTRSDGFGKLGNCVISGLPLVDGNNYVVEDSITCNGRLLAVKLQLRAAK